MSSLQIFRTSCGKLRGRGELHFPPNPTLSSHSLITIPTLLDEIKVTLISVSFFMVFDAVGLQVSETDGASQRLAVSFLH
jgi:hypothetical protein